MKVSTVAAARTIRLHANENEVLPEAFATALRESRVVAGWLRGVGVVADVVLRVAQSDGIFGERREAGPFQLVTLEGMVTTDAATTSLSAVLARDTGSGSETIAGAFVSARALSFDAMLIELESAAEIAVAAPVARERAPERAPAPVAAAAAPSRSTGGGNETATTSVSQNKAPPPPKPGGGLASATLPQRIQKREVEEVEELVPDAGDIVDHFAFGTCEVMKSEGDRLYLRMEKDQRIKEIALAMLRVVPLDLSSAPRLFKLERKLGG